MSTLYQTVAGTFIPLGLTLTTLFFVTDEESLLAAGIVFAVGGFISLFSAIRVVEREQGDRLKREREIDLSAEKRHEQMIELLKDINDNLRKETNQK